MTFKSRHFSFSMGDEPSPATGPGALPHPEVLDHPTETLFKSELLSYVSHPTSLLLIQNLKSMAMLELCH
jgi:hypothetical protein